MERELAWDGWAGNVGDAAVSPAGIATLTWAVSVIREFLGEGWLANNAARSGHVPLLSHQWWPLTNSRTVVRVLELATQIALVTSKGASRELLDEAKTIYATQDQVATKFQHLCLTLEVAAFAVTAGWSVSYEEPSSTGRRPDLTVRRRGISYSLEITALGLDREFRRIDRYSNKLHYLLRGLEVAHGVDIVCHCDEVLEEGELSAWIGQLDQACQRTAIDDQARTVNWRQSDASVFPDGQRPPGASFTGPSVNGEVWRRVATRIADKATQTIGNPAWLRIDDTGTLFRLTDRSHQPLQGLLADLQHNTSAALADFPHVRGIILSTGTMIDPGDARDDTAYGQTGSQMLIAPGPPRHVIADGPAAMWRILPGGRKRLTFVLPSPHSHVLLPAGAGLEPGLWYHEEPSWLTQAQQSLGHPPLDRIVRTSRKA